MTNLETLSAVIQNDIKYIRETLDALKEQVKIANGRTKKLEIFKSWVIGFCTCISILLLPILLNLIVLFIKK